MMFDNDDGRSQATEKMIDGHISGRGDTINQDGNCWKKERRKERKAA